MIRTKETIGAEQAQQILRRMSRAIPVEVDNLGIPILERFIQEHSNSQSKSDIEAEAIRKFAKKMRTAMGNLPYFEELAELYIRNEQKGLHDVKLGSTHEDLTYDAQ